MTHPRSISGLLCAVIAVALSAAPAQAQSDTTARLLQALAASQGQSASVTVGALPAGGVSGVPLPAEPVLGSIVSGPETAFASLGPAETTEVFYSVPDAKTAAAAYDGALERAGWKRRRPLQLGGFAASAFAQLDEYCGKGERYVTVRALKGDSGVFLVTIVRQEPAAMFDPCAAGSPLLRIETQMRSPLPELRAPQGIDMATPFPPANPFGSSSAYLHTTRPLGEMLAAFSGQLVKAGWIAGRDVVGADVAAETLTYGKPGQRWRAVLTVSRSGKGVEYANISAVREANE